MKIAYFIMLHNNFSQVKWILTALYNQEDYFIIHIDKNADGSFFQQVQHYVGNRPNVQYLTPRHVNRFGWSMVETELRAIRAFLCYKDDWKYVINVSGQDYPIKPIGTIKAKLTAEWPKNFLQVIPFTKVAEIDPHHPHLARKLSFELFGRVIKTRIPLPFPTKVDAKYNGSSWFMLSRDFCIWLLSDPISRRIANVVKYTYLPEELFLQILVMNSSYKNSLVDHYGREIIWPGSNGSPKTLCMDDYDLLSTSSALFARKFDESIDRQVLISLAHDHGYQVPTQKLRN